MAQSPAEVSPSECGTLSTTSFSVCLQAAVSGTKPCRSQPLRMWNVKYYKFLCLFAGSSQWHKALQKSAPQNVERYYNFVCSLAPFSAVLPHLPRTEVKDTKKGDTSVRMSFTEPVDLIIVDEGYLCGLS